MAKRFKPKNNTTSSTQKIASIKFPIIMLVLLCMIVSVATTMLVLINYSKTLVVDSAYGKMLNVVTSYGTLVEKTEGEKAMKPEAYVDLLSNVSLDGIDSANCYLVDKNGLILYHKDSSRVYKPNRNDVITKVTAGINKGVVPENMCTEYIDDDGIQKYASFFITRAKSIIVMEANADELMKPIQTIIHICIIIAVVLLIGAFAITWYITTKITAPLNQITKIINNTANLYLTAPQELDKLCNRKDETGEISRAVRTMSDNLTEVVAKIDSANTSIEQDMKKLEESSSQINNICNDNSSTAQSLAASTEEMAAMVLNISEHMQQMRIKSHDISDITIKNNEISEEVAGRARIMQAKTESAIEKTSKVYKLLKEKSDTAIEGIKAIEKINDLTEAISEISDQTSLLSLNASIEAARAGEAGRGFSIVATEISNLAGRSLDCVKSINDIIGEINSAVSNLSSVLEETSEFLEVNVLSDYDEFNKIGNQYMSDSTTFKQSMSNIYSEIDILGESIDEIASSLENIQITMTDTTNGVSDIADRTTDVAKSTTDNYELTNNTSNSVNELKLIVNKFTL